MSLGSYPLVYLPVAAALRTSDPALEDVARGLGLGRLRTFSRVTFHQIRPALVGGSLLVALILLAEFGTFEILGFQTFTTEIYTEYQRGYSAHDRLRALARPRRARADPARRRGGRARAARRRAARTALAAAEPRPARPAGGTGCACARGAPRGSRSGCRCTRSATGSSQGTSSTFPPISIAEAALHTADYSGLAAALATVAAIPIALLADRYRSRTTVAMERSTYIVQALPGIVVALSFVYFTIRYVPNLYLSSFELVVAYAVMFFPLALVAVRAGVAQAPLGLEEVGRSLGHGRLSVLRRITLPVLAPSLVAGFSLVFISASTELTATLILHPTGVNTLATGFWSFTNDFSYGAAAPYALALLLVAMLPGLVLGRRFERIAGRRAE